MKRRNKKTAGRSFFLIKLAVISGFFGIAAFFLVCCLMAFAFAFVSAADIFYNAASLLAIAAGSFVCGGTGAFLRRKSGMVTGVLCSMEVFAAALAAFWSVGADASGYKILAGLLIAVISGASGGVYGVNKHIRKLPLIYAEKNRN